MRTPCPRPHMAFRLLTVWLSKQRGRVLVKEHVGITQEPAHEFRSLRWVGVKQLLLWSAQEVPQLRTGSDLRNVVATLIVAMSVGHAVKEEPGVRVRAVFDKGHVVTGVNAEHGEQLHGAPGYGAVNGYICCDCYSTGRVILTSGMGVYLSVASRAKLFDSSWL